MEQKPKTKVGAYDRIIKATGMFGGVQGLVTMIIVARAALVSRLLGTVGFGINESYNRTLNLVKSATDLGLSFSAVRRISECVEAGDNENLVRNINIVRMWEFVTAVGGTLLCALLAPLFSLWAFEGDSGYTLSFVLLSPVVGFAAINGGEMAILKGIRQLKDIAVAQMVTAFCSFAVSVPLFWMMGLKGLVPSLVLVSAASASATCFFSFRAYPFRLAFGRKSRVLADGLDMIKIGVFFTITSFLGSGAFSVVANFLMNSGGAEVCGAYSAGYLLVSYLGLFVFSAMEVDYFPRLSSVNRETRRVTLLVNRQAEVALLLMAPMVAFFLLFLPWVVTVFLSQRFAMAIPLTRLAALGMLFKSVTQPTAYIALAKGDSKTFLLQELIYDVCFVALVVVCFKTGGLRFIGLALLVAGVVDLLVVGSIACLKYHFRYSKKLLSVLLVQLILLALMYCVVQYQTGLMYWLPGAVIALTSAAISVRLLSKKTSFVTAFKGKFKAVFPKES